MRDFNCTEQNTDIQLNCSPPNMLQFLVVALLVAGVLGKDHEPVKAAEPVAEPTEAKTVAKDAESVEMRIPLLDHYDYNDKRNDNLYLKAKLDGHHPEGPIVARKLPSTAGHRPDIAAQDEIIKFTYSPAYYEPVWLLDYRFLKSGGRRYTRGPGGQILILPKSYRHHKGDGTHDYDSMIEHLRLKMIAEQNQRNREHRFGLEHGHEHGYEERHGYEQEERRYRLDERRERERVPVNPYH